MAFDMSIKIGDVEGESVVNDHKGEIDVLSWGWGVTNSGSAHQGTGIGAGKANVQDLSFTKYVDKATPHLLLAACSGRHHPQAVLTVRKAGGERPVEYLRITLTDLLVSSVASGGSAGEDRLTENVALNFARVEVTYTPQDARGQVGKPVTMSWNVAENRK